jgi:hypothetical protein
MYLLVALIALMVGGFVAISLTLGEDRNSSPASSPPAPSPEKIDTVPSSKSAVALIPSKKSSSNVSLDPQSPDSERIKDVQSQVERGAQWLAAMNGADGRFAPGLIPALNRPLDADDYIRQLEAVAALARAARQLNNADYTARATHAVLRFLDDTVTDTERGQLRCGGPAVDADHLAAAGLLVSAINELALPQADILDKSEQLCRFIASRQQEDGAFRCGNGAPDSKTIDNGGNGAVPGYALCGLMVSQRHRPAKWKTDVVSRALGFYRAWWKGHHNAELVASQSPAYAEAFLLTKSQDFADAVFEMNDWLCTLQYSQLDPRHQEWWGGFKPSPDEDAAPHVHGCTYARSLAAACRLAREVGDAQRFDRQYRPALDLWRIYVTRLQYVEANTQHFAPVYRRTHLLGGFHASPEDGNLRIDFNAQAVCALLEYLGGALRAG